MKNKKKTKKTRKKGNTSGTAQNQAAETELAHIRTHPGAEVTDRKIVRGPIATSGTTGARGNVPGEFQRPHL